MPPVSSRILYSDARRGKTEGFSDIVRPSRRIAFGTSVLPAAAALDTDSFARPDAVTEETTHEIVPRPDTMPFWSVRRITIAVLAVLAAAAGTVSLVAIHPGANTQAGSFGDTQIPLNRFAKTASSLKVTTIPSLSVHGQLRVANSLLLAPTAQPGTAQAGQIYYDQTANALRYYNGSQYVSLFGGNAPVQNTTNLSVTNINGVPSATTAVGGVANQLAKFTGGQTLGNSIISDNGQNVTITGNLNLLNTAPSPEMTIWDSTTVPGTVDYLDNLSVEVGIKFQSDVDGIVSGIRFYKGPLNTGPHIGTLWSVSGVQLASVTFTNETASGWQDARLSSPVSIAAGTTYVVSYHTTVGQYAADTSYFLGSGFDHAPLHALQDGMDGGNGVFKYSATPTFPSNNGGGSNYWVDVDFTPSSNPFHFMLNGAQIASSALSNNFDLAKRSSGQVFSGTNTFRNVNDSGAGFSIQSADSTDLLVADTGAKIIIVKTLLVTGDATFEQHIVGVNQNNPPIVSAGTAACTSPTVTVSGTDISGLITVTTGTGCTGVGKLATLTYAHAYGTPPNVTLTAANAAAASLNMYVDSGNATISAVDLWAASGTINNTTTYKWYYQITQ